MIGQKRIYNISEFKNSYIFFELHGIKKSEAYTYGILDIYHNLYMLSNGMVVYYSRESPPRLFLPLYKIMYPSPHINLIFDRYTELMPIYPYSIMVRIAWNEEWIISIKHNVQSSWVIYSNTYMTLQNIFENILQTSDKGRCYIYNLDLSDVHRPPILVCTYSYVGQTMRRDLQYNIVSTFNLKSVEDIYNYCNKNKMSIMYYHPKDGNNVIIQYQPVKINPSEISQFKKDYIATYYGLISSGAQDIDKILNQKHIPRDYALENSLRELPNYLIRAMTIDSDFQHETDSENIEKAIIDKIKAEIISIPLGGNIVACVIKNLAICNPSDIVTIIQNMNDKARHNII